jgi:hypothetical protein
LQYEADKLEHRIARLQPTYDEYARSGRFARMHGGLIGKASDLTLQHTPSDYEALRLHRQMAYLKQDLYTVKQVLEMDRMMHEPAGEEIKF